MTCKDCLCYDACNENAYMGELEDEREKPCQLFKNKKDYVKVIHAYWCKDPVTGYMSCSNCKALPPGDGELNDFYESDFCPCCGADMNYTEEVEICPYCDKENVFPMWDTEEQGFVATCQHCGEEILLCDACMHTVCYDGEPHGCDWSGTDCGGKCHRGETTRKKASDSDE